MKYLRQLALIMFAVMMLPAVAHANMGPAILVIAHFHLMFLTWIIGLGEGLLLCTFLRAWKYPSLQNKIFLSMLAANITSACLGVLFVNSTLAARIMGDVTIENLMPAFWTMVYVTYVLTMLIEFPFFLVPFYGRKKWVLKAVAATLLVHTISYYLLFNFYHQENYSMNMITELEVVPASAFEMIEDYDLYYISPDGKQVMRSDMSGNGKEIIATLDMQGIPDRLRACPRKLIPEEDGANRITVQRVCWESGFDLFVLMNVDGKYKTELLLENFSPCSAVCVFDGAYIEWWNEKTNGESLWFRSFGDAKNWEFRSENLYELPVHRLELDAESYARNPASNNFTYDHADYRVATAFARWRVQCGTHISGDYGVFQLGKDQICILDPEKKRIALIARGFGPVVAKPPLEAPQEVNKEQSTNEVK